MGRRSRMMMSYMQTAGSIAGRGVTMRKCNDFHTEIVRARFDRAKQASHICARLRRARSRVDLSRPTDRRMCPYARNAYAVDGRAVSGRQSCLQKAARSRDQKPRLVADRRDKSEVTRKNCLVLLQRLFLRHRRGRAFFSRLIR